MPTRVNGTEYFISPRIPGVRPADPPDYDGITFVYVFTSVLTPWTVPPVLGNAVLVVANSQGFVAGMSIMVENAGYYQVVAASALDRLTVMNLGYSTNQPPGSGIFPGKITTTSLPGPPGQIGPPGPMGPPGPSGGGGGTTQIISGETPTGAINGVNTNYTTAYPYVANTLAVFLNGLRQRRANDYNETGTQSFSFLSVPLPGDSLSIDYVQA